MPNFCSTPCLHPRRSITEKRSTPSLKWWTKHGFQEIPQEADPKLESCRKAPSWRRICKTLLKNDYWCKGLSFGQTKRDMERQAQLIMKYMEL